MDRRFSASGFWDTCRSHGITAFNFQGAMLTLLQNRPPRPDDPDNPVRVGFGAACPPEVTEAFERRFGVALTEIYGSTEASLVAVVLVPGARLDGPGVVAHCTGRLTEFALPRYVRFLDALPVTPSQRTEKYTLRADGVTADTWDREA